MGGPPRRRTDCPPSPILKLRATPQMILKLRAAPLARVPPPPMLPPAQPVAPSAAEPLAGTVAAYQSKCHPKKFKCNTLVY